MTSVASRRLWILTAALAAAFALVPASALASPCTSGTHIPEVTITPR
jgi:hypothetical protein